jgi:hypothetical protein
VTASELSPAGLVLAAMAEYTPIHGAAQFMRDEIDITAAYLLVERHRGSSDEAAGYFLTTHQTFESATKCVLASQKNGWWEVVKLVHLPTGRTYTGHLSVAWKRTMPESARRGHAFVQNPDDPTEPDCDECGIMRGLHGGTI